ncbi:hypothetical protein IV203_019108 [Nitzschia inconspicua]|uniref:Uncharacterized protein n=1 Tax=Nitzschia inconspicua TaxID=303405 RepID=A0A9K3LXT0_9STRA|nr:hypothetical protein IV203_019108 [Nitzschia inconspicua]
MIPDRWCQIFLSPWSFRGIPVEIQAFRDGWEEVTVTNVAYEVVLEGDFLDSYASDKMCSAYREMGKKISDTLTSRGKEVTNVTILDHLLGDVALSRIEDYTTQMLVKKNLPPLVPFEFKEFLLTRWFRSRFNVPTDVAFREGMGAISHSRNFNLMEEKRFLSILCCIRGFAQNGRSGCDDEEVWMQQRRVLRNFHDLEIAVFSRSVETLLEKCLIGRNP